MLHYSQQARSLALCMCTADAVYRTTLSDKCGACAGSPKPKTPQDCSGRNVSSYSYYYSEGEVNLKNATSVCHGSQSIPTTDYVLPWSRASPTKNFTAPLQPGAFTTSGYNYTAHAGWGRRLTEWLFGEP